MCDYTAGAVQGAHIRVLVVELKNGAADPEAIEQLQEGMNLIREHLDEPSASIRPEAYLVAEKHTAHLKHLLRSSRERLRFGQSKVLVQARKCGEMVEVEE